MKKKSNRMQICSDKQEALESNLKAYNKQWKWVKKSRSGRLAQVHVRAELQSFIFTH